MTNGSEGQGPSSDLAERTALSLITSDLLLFRDLALRRRQETIDHIAWLALMPWLSMFVFESAMYFERRSSVSFLELKPHENLLRSSRLRLKLLDDDHRSFAELLESASNLAAINTSWFLQSHHGLLGRMKRLLQPDLGVYFVQNEVICTTHVAFLNLGLTEEDLTASSLSMESLGPYLKTTTEDFGRYMRVLLEALGLHANALTNSPETPLPQVGYRDLKSERFYGAMARRIAPEQVPICILLTSILSQVNTVKVLMPLIASENEIAIFKMRFISLYHAASSLQKLLNLNRRSRLLEPEVEREFSAMLGEDTIRLVRKNSRLRNNLVHYAVDERMTSILPSPIRRSRPNPGATASNRFTTSTTASSTASRRSRTVTTPSCCTSSSRSRAPARRR